MSSTVDSRRNWSNFTLLRVASEWSNRSGGAGGSSLTAAGCGCCLPNAQHQPRAALWPRARCTPKLDDTGYSSPSQMLPGSFAWNLQASRFGADVPIKARDGGNDRPKGDFRLITGDCVWRHVRRQERRGDISKLPIIPSQVPYPVKRGRITEGPKPGYIFGKRLSSEPHVDRVRRRWSV